jgi:hypothetical protein
LAAVGIGAQCLLLNALLVAIARTLSW